MNKLYIIPLAALMVGCGQNVTVNVPSTGTADTSEVKVVDTQATSKGRQAVIEKLKTADIQVKAKGRVVETGEVKILDTQASSKGLSEEKTWDEQAAAKGAVEIDEETFTQAELEAYNAEQAEAQEAQAALIEASTQAELVTLGSGSFAAAGTKYDISGGVTIEEKDGEVMIILSDDFSVSNGPDLYVTLSQEQPFTGGKKVELEESKVKLLGALANTSGKQVYTVSKADFDQFDYGVTIWCKKYNVLFGATPIQ